ncbi:hypothetical protein RI129_007240 [Pyrocoelia pectoralis]|uniref:Uncharacterized protein n=1 Tax=Pyrocoelia pectoralis TaxID=417401 RepID=A0AAN7V7N8_9COLE
MMTDTRQTIRELALRRIMKARQERKLQTKIRQFVVPTINFEAKDYIDLIDWSNITVTEPPVTKFLTDTEIQNFIESGDHSKITFPRFPCHTQSVETLCKASD